MMQFDFIHIKNDKDFAEYALYLFKYQYDNIEVYRKYVDLLSIKPQNVKSIKDIPFLPISFFKYHKILAYNQKEKVIFKSSGTTLSTRSKHFVANINLYEKSFITGFNHFFGDFKNYCFLALLPSYLEQGNSSLVYMINYFIKHSNCKESNFYLYDFEKLKLNIQQLIKKGKKVILFGVSYALLDFAEYAKFDKMPDNFMVFETGGMKGRRKELPKSELHKLLKKGLGVDQIFSEYGMTELLSQAYSFGNNLYQTVPWMKILIRDRYDPFEYLSYKRTGGINIIDLANKYSCAFIETEDLGKLYPNNKFEILGRFDTADIRGCNLMIGE